MKNLDTHWASRRSLTAFVMFASSLAVGFGLTSGTARSSGKASGAFGGNAQSPATLFNQTGEDVKKDFNDDDLKVKNQKPRGKWGIVLETDMDQFYDASVPVAVGAVQSLSGGGKYAGVVKIKRLEIKNRSSKAVNSVQLRWEIVSLDNPAKVLLEGTTPFANFWAEANSAKVIEIPTIHPALLFKPLAKDDELHGRFQLTIGVQEARFADGSFWRRQEAVNALHFDWSLFKQFPSIAAILPDIPPPTRPDNRWGTITPCQAAPRSSASAFYFVRFQTTSCKDDMTAVVDPETGKQSCGAYSLGQACYSECSADGWCTVYRVPGGRCNSPTATPTPTPTPTPSGNPYKNYPNCCLSFSLPTIFGLPGGWGISCNCPDGTWLPNDCYVPFGDTPCNATHESTAFGTQQMCCPKQSAGCEEGCQGDMPDDSDGHTIGEQTDLGPCPCASPILIDVLGDGFRLTNFAGGVFFDLDANGRRGRLSWTAAGSDDSWLALDRNGDGLIGDGRELFGNHTPQPAPPAGASRNGFLALAEFDRAGNGGNSDGVIDAKDAVYARLLLWRDENHDGVSQASELRALASADVVRLRLDYKESKRADEYGNRFRYRAKVEDAKGLKVGRWAWDVFLLSKP